MIQPKTYLVSKRKYSIFIHSDIFVHYSEKKIFTWKVMLDGIENKIELKFQWISGLIRVKLNG